MTENDVSGGGPIEDLLGVVPRLLDRTSRQIDFSRALLGHLPCLPGRLALLSGQDSTRSTARTTQVVSRVGDTAASVAVGSGPVTVPSPAHDTTDSAASRRVNGSDARSGGSVSPSETDLAIPQYDSLAASQVIPRLELLEPQDLRMILDYEEARRNRQTIVHKVRQLLSTNTA